MAMLEARPYRPFKSSEEYLEAMKEDLAEWLSTLYPELMINAENFMDRLDTGVALCKHANYVRQAAEDYLARRQARNKSMTRSMTSGIAGPILSMGNVHYLTGAKSGTFFARDNVSNFIAWCRKGLKIIECLLFETDDLIMRKNEKHVILCLLEVARRGAKFGMLAPMLVQMERQIDREIAADNKAKGIGCGTQTDASTNDGTQMDAGVGTENIATETELFDSDSENEEDDEGPMLMYGPQPQIITNDLKSLDEMVRDLVEKCTCPSQFPMVRVSEGKYRIGDTKVLIFVRILRSHVMVRVGGGWDTLSHYLDKHDPCRCKAQHRSAVAARLIPRTSNQSNGIELHKAQVIFERSPPTTRKVISNLNANNSNTSPPSDTATTPSFKSNLSPSYAGVKTRSRSPTPQRKYLNHLNNLNDTNATPAPVTNEKLREQTNTATALLTSAGLARRSMSPSPRRLIDIRKKQTSLDSYSNGPKSLPLTGVELNTNNHVQFDSLNLMQPEAELHQQHVNGNAGGEAVTTTSSTTSSNSQKFDNISDNGSEISDEGYRSLGVIQSNAQKRESMHSQASIEDAENNARLDQTSSDSQLSPVDDQTGSTKTPEIQDVDYASLPHESQIDAGPQSLPAILHDNLYVSNKFEQSGIFITDDEITVDIAAPSNDLPNPNTEKDSTDGGKIAEKATTTSQNNKSKIPCSPRAERRRCSIDNSTCRSGSLQDISARTGLPVFNRNKPVYRSVRKPALQQQQQQTAPKAPTPVRKSNAAAVRDVTNTWSGRTSLPAGAGGVIGGGGKKRPTITADTFTPGTSNQAAVLPATANNGSASSPFERNTKARSSQILYDSNGRRVRGCSASLNTSPVKNQASSPLAQQLLEAASSAKNDAQILEKMKALLSRYAAKNQTPSTVKSTANAKTVASSSKNTNTPAVYEDFTSAWVHSNGNLERSNSCSPPTKMRSKRSSAASSCESTNSRDMSLNISPRRERAASGLSKIPAPVQRQRTELY